MPAEPERVPAEAARRLLLQGQGLLRDPARRATPAIVHREIERLGYVQVDTISVVERAHHHILMSRFDGYRPAMLAKLLERDRKLFEHWTHDACVIPTREFAYWRLRFERYRAHLEKRGYWQRRDVEQPQRALDHVRERLRSEGPLRSADFEEPEHKGGNWWAWKPTKAALEYLWRVGEVTVTARQGFQKVYELTERVFPEQLAEPLVSEEAHEDWACGDALQRLGVATLTEIRSFYDALTPQGVQRWAQRARDRGEAIDVRLESVDGSRPKPGLALPDWARRAARAPEAPARMRLLSPFDPAVRERARALRVFGFDYRFEAFTPAAKRRYGYYVLPLLEGDRIVGRLDSKLHRDRGELVVRKVWWEPGVRPTAARKRALRDAVGVYTEQAGGERFALPRGL